MLATKPSAPAWAQGCCVPRHAPAQPGLRPEATGRQCPCSDLQDNLPDRAVHER
ncbi:MAG TPA: hypothetical protein VFV57_12505 [Limnobacter sp.]|nr:hypothetical protein [Limnobacter sp.]